MPYRRLPNTDKARIRSLEKAVRKTKENDYYVPIIAPELLVRAEKMLISFKEANSKYINCVEKQMEFSRSGIYQTKLKTARMYVSHFITVFNLCVKRGEFKTTDRIYYSMTANQSELPDLSSDISVLRWCENIIRGESTRISKGGVPIYNPTVAKVAVHYELFEALYNRRCELKKLSENYLVAVAALRPRIDAVILDVWNSVESYFANLSGDTRLNACREYGLIYYYRSSEKSH